jgi:hypothetical protein
MDNESIRTKEKPRRAGPTLAGIWFLLSAIRLWFPMSAILTTS